MRGLSELPSAVLVTAVMVLLGALLASIIMGFGSSVLTGEESSGVTPTWDWFVEGNHTYVAVMNPSSAQLVVDIVFDTGAGWSFGTDCRVISVTVIEINTTQAVKIPPGVSEVIDCPIQAEDVKVIPYMS